MLELAHAILSSDETAIMRFSALTNMLQVETD